MKSMVVAYASDDEDDQDVETSVQVDDDGQISNASASTNEDDDESENVIFFKFHNDFTMLFPYFDMFLTSTTLFRK